MPSHNHSALGIGVTTDVNLAKNKDAYAALRSVKYSTLVNENGYVSDIGGSQPHNNMQPYTVVNYIIATGKDTGVSVSDIVSGAQAIPLGVEYGGTGATNVTDARKNLGVRAVARNLLDNSDFRNPVNQRGFAGGAVGPYQYCIDRWCNYTEANVNLEFSLSDNGITFSKTVDAQLSQYIPNISRLFGKMITVALGFPDGTVVCNCATVPNTAWSSIVSAHYGAIRIMAHTFDGSKGVIFINAVEGITISWAALYEGEYTAETLPEYQPKEYIVELLNCRRYYRVFHRHGFRPYNASSSTRYYRIPIDPPMIAIPTVTVEGCTERPINSWTATGATIAVSSPSRTEFTISATGNNSATDFSIVIDSIIISADL